MRPGSTAAINPCSRTSPESATASGPPGTKAGGRRAGRGREKVPFIVPYVARVRPSSPRRASPAQEKPADPFWIAAVTLPFPEAHPTCPPVISARPVMATKPPGRRLPSTCPSMRPFTESSLGEPRTEQCNIDALPGCAQRCLWAAAGDPEDRLPSPRPLPFRPHRSRAPTVTPARARPRSPSPCPSKAAEVLSPCTSPRTRHSPRPPGGPRPAIAAATLPVKVPSTLPFARKGCTRAIAIRCHAASSVPCSGVKKRSTSRAQSSLPGRSPG